MVTTNRPQCGKIGLYFFKTPVSGHDKMDINGLENSPPLAK